MASLGLNVAQQALAGADEEVENESWDATTSWDMRIEVPARLIEHVDDNVKARRSSYLKCLICIGSELTPYRLPREHSDQRNPALRLHGSSYLSRTAEIWTLLH